MTAPVPEVTISTRAHRGRVVDSLVAAFSNDPVLRYLFPDESAYPADAAVFFGYLFDKRVDKETVWTIERGTSVAIWEPPAVLIDTPDESLADQLPPDALARFRSYEDALHTMMPSSPYWYLGVLGTHPDYAGRRWGHAVMAAGLERATSDGLLAILETSNPANVDVYHRAGWRVVCSVTDPLPTWLMQHSSQ